MQFSTDHIDAALAPARAFAGADVRDLARGDLLAAQAAVANVRRAAEVLLASIAGEVARRSAPDLGAGSLARTEGYSSAPRLIAAATGGSLADAHRLIEAGAALAPSPQAPDDAPPAGSLRAALVAGEVGVEAGALIRSTLAKVADPDGELERRLVRQAREVGLAELRTTCLRAEAFANNTAWREREKRQYALRFASMTTDHDGMMVFTARLDPPSALPVKAWLDAQVRDAFQRQRDHGPEGQAEPADTRTAGQMRADALVSLARHGLACDEPTSGVSTTVIVRMDVDALRSGLGLGDADAMAAPISVEALRRAAADAEVIPMVLGGPSEVLDLGRSRRLFTRAQRLALVERDGGCAWCHAPSSYCEAHHIRWWDRDTGPTDLSNGVLLCTSCHHRLHDTGWEVRIREGRAWFVPPASVDPERVPRLGGKARLDLGYEVLDSLEEYGPSIAVLDPAAALVGVGVGVGVGVNGGAVGASVAPPGDAVRVTGDAVGVAVTPA